MITGVGIAEAFYQATVAARKPDLACRHLPPREMSYEGGMEIEVVIEIPKGTRNKYEADHETGAIWLDRMLFTATRYPEDYGYVPDTLAEDGDPLDALVVLEEPTFPGCHICARPLGVFLMRDEAGEDAKVLCVPATDPRAAHMTELDHVAPYELDEIAHFFAIYKQLEPGKDTQVEGWKDRPAAEEAIEQSRRRFQGQGQHAADATSPERPGPQGR
jgi:inorganic pyrophosphatase